MAVAQLYVCSHVLRNLFVAFAQLYVCSHVLRIRDNDYSRLDLGRLHAFVNLCLSSPQVLLSCGIEIVQFYVLDGRVPLLGVLSLPKYASFASHLTWL